MKKGIGIYIRLVSLSFFLLMTFSLLFPDRSLQLDMLRLKIQTPIMHTLSKFDISNSNSLNSFLKKEYEVINYTELNKYLHRIEPATIIFTNNTGFFSNVFIRGEWKHTAIFLGTKEQVEEKFGKNSDIYAALTPYYKTQNEVLILDSSYKGVLIREFKELCNLYSVSSLRSLVCINIKTSESELQTFVRAALHHIGKTYDYDLKTNDDSSFYCSELVCKCLNSIDIKVDIRSHLLGRSYVSPNDMVSYIYKKGMAVNEFSLQLVLIKENGIVTPRYPNNINRMQYSYLHKQIKL